MSHVQNFLQKKEKGDYSLLLHFNEFVIINIKFFLLRELLIKFVIEQNVDIISWMLHLKFSN